MQYTILVYQTPADFAAADNPDPALQHAYWAYLEAMKKAGVFVFGTGLKSPETATTLRFRDDKHIVQDGPYADTKEQLGGFFVIDVADLDTAMQWTARIPRTPGRVYEVRPIPSYGG